MIHFLTESKQVFTAIIVNAVSWSAVGITRIDQATELLEFAVAVFAVITGFFTTLWAINRYWKELNKRG